MTNINAALLRQLCSINLLCSDTTVKSKFDKSVTLFITPCKIQNKINFKSCGNSKRRKPVYKTSKNHSKEEIMHWNNSNFDLIKTTARKPLKKYEGLCCISPIGHVENIRRY